MGNIGNSIYDENSELKQLITLSAMVITHTSMKHISNQDYKHFIFKLIIYWLYYLMILQLT